MTPRPTTLFLLRFAAALLVVYVVAGALDLATAQAAYSPLALALPNAPFAQLGRELGFLAFGSALLGLAVPFLAADEEPRDVATAFAVGATLKVLTLSVAAALHPAETINRVLKGDAPLGGCGPIGHALDVIG